MVFADRSVLQNFSSEIACAVGLGHAILLSNLKSFPANYKLVLQLQNFSTLNDLQSICNILYIEGNYLSFLYFVVNRCVGNFPVVGSHMTFQRNVIIAIFVEEIIFLLLLVAISYHNK